MIETLKCDYVACMHACTHEGQGLQITHACVRLLVCVFACVCLYTAHL